MHHGSITQHPGLGALPKVILKHKSGSAAEVYLFGGTMTSYIPKPEHEDLLFVSKNAIFDGKKAIRGGIPLVFPQFGQPNKDMAQHGFARTSTWELAEKIVAGDVVKAVLHLSDTESTRAIWPHPFALSYTISLTAKALTTSLRIDNPASSTSSFNAQALLHTYLRVKDIHKVAIKGFHGVNYIDKVDNNNNKHNNNPREDRDVATINQETDRIYQTGANQVQLKVGGRTKVQVEYTACVIHPDGSDTRLSPDCVLWNPWTEKAKAMADFGDEEYQNMVCVEPGLVSSSHAVAPGHSLVLEQTIQAVDDE